jgi:hypothetical protein
MKNKIISLLCFSIIFLSLLPAVTYSLSVDARCPNGYHKSPSGDCERVTHSGGLPRCSDGYHRSPDGDCEPVSSEGSGNSGSTDSENDGQSNDDNEGEADKSNGNDESQNIDETSESVTEAQTSQSTDCKGTAECFRGIVTEIVDGDTLDVNDMRVRLAMVDTPEEGKEGYDEATETTKSECPVGSEALVDEDDGQMGGSFDRLIGIVYCNGNSSSLNELLPDSNKAVLYEDFCGVSEFSSDGWVTTH